MSVYQRGDIWWYKFKIRGQMIRESAGTSSQSIARRAERKRRIELEEGINRLKPIKTAVIFSTYSRHWIEENTPHWSISNRRIETYNVGHLTKHFGKMLLTDISPASISHYQAKRKAAGVSPRTINMEVGSLRAMLRKERLWANLQPDIKMLRAKSDIGRALSPEEELNLLAACKKSRSRSLYPAVLLSLHTGLRNEELRLLRWCQIDFLEKTVSVGKSKTVGGEGRIVPLSETAWGCLKRWRSEFPSSLPAHFVFPSECYGLAGEDGYAHGEVVRYNVMPDKPIGSWKVSWTTARSTSGVQCRWHDLRHTFVSRMGEAQASETTVKALAGHLSTKMMERYSHARNEAKRAAIASLDIGRTQTQQ